MNEWIKTSDTLPENMQHFLGLCDGAIDHYIFYTETEIMCVGSSNMTREDLLHNFVTHWMPLPEMPENYNE